MIREQYTLLKNLDVTSYYSNDHSMNLMMELEGSLPNDKQKLLDTMQQYLDLNDDKKRLFNYGFASCYLDA